jgi:hypothetical protein
MFERNLTATEVHRVIASGEVIAAYPDDQPFPTYLIFGWGRSRPLHVLVAVEAESRRCLVVTAYVPDPALWREDFKIRRTP